MSLSTRCCFLLALGVAAQDANPAVPAPVDALRQPDGAPSTAFALNSFSGFDQIIRHPLADFTAFVVVGPQAANFSGMDFDPMAVTLWAVDPVAARLGVVSQSTGVFTIGPQFSIANVGGFAIDPVDGRFFVTAPGTNGSEILRVDSNSGAAVLVASVNGTAFAALAIDCQQRLFAYDVGGGSNTLYSINLGNGSGTPIGATGAGALGASMDFDNATGTLVAWLYLGSGNASYGTIDTATGAFSLAATAAGRFEGSVRNACAPTAPLIFANGFEG